MLNKLKALAESDRALTVADQMILSATNLLTSVIVVKTAGPAMFGIYSVIMVVVNLLCSGFSALVSGQMMLTVADSRLRARCSFVRSTFGLHLFANVTLAILVALVWTTVASAEATGLFQTRDVIAAIALVFALSSFEFFRQYLYVTRKFRLSVILTGLFATMHLAVLGVLVFFVSKTAVVALSVASLAAGYLLAVALNREVWRAMARGKALSAHATRALFARYWKQGKFGLSGLFLTWVQNQSLSIILLWYQGVLIVGYYNLARLMLMPLSVFNMGLLKGLTPQLRRLARKHQLVEVASLADRQARFSLVVLTAYAIALALLYWSALLDPYINYINEVWPFVVVWFLVTGLTVFRSWLSQFFIARMDFRYLLQVSFVAAVATMALVACAILLDVEAVIFSISIAFGEIVMMVLTYRKRKAILRAKENLPA